MNISSKPFPKDFLSIADLDAQQIRQVLSLATKLKSKRKTHKASLQNKIVGIMSTKPSLRTRMSFEVGLLELGAQGLFIRGEEIGLGTRESYPDVAAVLSRYLDAFVVRSNDHQGLEQLAQHAQIPIINALTDQEHPCQTLADLLTIQEHFARLDDLHIVYVGNVNNVSNSLLLAAALLGLDCSILSPPLTGAEEAFCKPYLEQARKIAQANCKINISQNLDIVEHADILYTDVWVSMGSESSDPAETRQRFAAYQINEQLLKNKNIPVLHCLPAHKDEEISEKIFDRNASLIFEQSENRLHAQKALLQLLLSAD